MRQQKTSFPGGETTVTVMEAYAGMYRVIVIHRFDSGNFITERDEIVSLVAAEGMLAFYKGD